MLQIQLRSQHSYLSIARIQRHPCQPAHCPRLRLGLHCNLCRWILRRPQGETWSPYHVCIIALIWKSGRFKLPSIPLCIGGTQPKVAWTTRTDKPSCCRLHHLDFFQITCVIIRCRVPWRVVSTAAVLARRGLMNPPPFPAEFSQPVVSTQYLRILYV